MWNNTFVFGTQDIPGPIKSKTYNTRTLTRKVSSKSPFFLKKIWISAVNTVEYTVRSQAQARISTVCTVHICVSVSVLTYETLYWLVLEQRWSLPGWDTGSLDDWFPTPQTVVLHSAQRLRIPKRMPGVSDLSKMKASRSFETSVTHSPSDSLTLQTNRCANRKACCLQFLYR